MLSLSDNQLQRVMQASALLALNRRDDFLRRLATVLGDTHDLSDGRLTFLLCELLGQHGVCVGPGYFRRLQEGRGRLTRPANERRPTTFSHATIGRGRLLAQPTEASRKRTRPASQDL
jgi:hypothetical protein